MKKPFAFTLIELMVVVMIVGILAAASVPLMQIKIDRSKWSEANGAAGSIRTAVRLYFIETGNSPTGSMNVAATQQALNMQAGDLAGTFFTASDYNIDSVNADGVAVVTVTGSQSNAPSGSKTLTASGTWQ